MSANNKQLVQWVEREDGSVQITVQRTKAVQSPAPQPALIPEKGPSERELELERKLARHQGKLEGLKQQRDAWGVEKREHRKEVRELTKRLGSVETKLKLYEPAYKREQKKLKETTSARIGKDGEAWAMKSLRAAFGSQAEIRDTSKESGAGDLQVLWGGHTLVTVESKHSEQPNRMLPAAFARQAREQIVKTKAHAGILLYSGPIGPGKTIDVREAERLVVVGRCREEGQVVAGLLHALLIARQFSLKEKEEKKDLLTLSSSDCRSVKHALSLFSGMLGYTREALEETRRSVMAASKKQKAEAKVVVETLCEEVRPEIVARLFPSTFCDKVAVKHEVLSKPSSFSKKKGGRKRRAVSAASPSINLGDGMTLEPCPKRKKKSVFAQFND